MAVKTFQIKFSAAPGEYEINYKLDFRTYHKVIYTDITNNNYPTEVIDGGDLNVTFSEDLKNILVLSNGEEINSYNQITNGQTITIENVESDIEIKKKAPVARLVNGRIDEVGGEVCIGEECFYIISNDGSTVTMLAKYNLYVGYYMYTSSVVKLLESPTGKQDETARGNFNDEYPYIGVVAFSDESNDYSNDYSESIIKGYVDSYNNYLNSLGASLINARLITKDELGNLGCGTKFSDRCSEAPDFVYSTSYWTGSPTGSDVYTVMGYDAKIYSTEVEEISHFGVRPVIELLVDDIYVPPIGTIVSGDLDTVGSEVCIKEECFYVISSTSDTVTMLAKYNLYVGNSVASNGNVNALSFSSTLQDSTARGIAYDDNVNIIYPIIGTTAFSNTGTTYSGSLVQQFVNEYDMELYRLGANTLEARLVSREELIKLGCNNNSCSSAPKFVYSTSYWLGTAYDSNNVFRVNSYSQFGYHNYTTNTYFGVRPVITVSKTLFNV